MLGCFATHHKGESKMTARATMHVLRGVSPPTINANRGLHKPPLFPKATLSCVRMIAREIKKRREVLRSRRFIRFSFMGENFENYLAVVVAAAFFFDLIKQVFYQKELPILLVNSTVFSRRCVHPHRVFRRHVLRRDGFQKLL